MNHPTELHSWKQLKRCAANFSMSSDTMLHNASISSNNIIVDYSGQSINTSILAMLIELAHESKLSKHIHALFEGLNINHTENRPALHTALRTPEHETIYVNNRNIVADVLEVRQKMDAISTQIRSGQWLGHTGKSITDIVNLGIGGSMLGPFFCTNALSNYATTQLKFHFIADVDPHTFSRISAKLNPETTLFIVSSKSFTTPETLFNMKKAIMWLNKKEHLDKHFIAITANIKKAQELGFRHILPIWEWVGGRYSSCSAINLITCIAIGYKHFSDLLSGANSMDNHFRTTEFSKNVPVLLALLGIWNINFLNNNNLLILTYSENLKYFVPYLQQLDMESNGKSINKQGQQVNYNTGPIIWGGPGNHAQHSYYQLLCQGTHKINADLLSIKTFDNEAINKMCMAHQKVLTQGITIIEDNPYNNIHGKIPLNHISLGDLSPKTLGSLIALYEHKIFVQSVIWNINPFDQPGVERAKKIFDLFSNSIA